MNFCIWNKGVRRPGVYSLAHARNRYGDWGSCTEILPRWLHPTRLETRTKESILYASDRVGKPDRVEKSRTSIEIRKDADASNPDSSKRDLRKSIYGRTRKMVNYTWVGWSQRKLWWKLEALLTCKSFVKLACRGERLIELSSSWFPLKFLSG
jgi:hypothetical protein